MFLKANLGYLSEISLKNMQLLVQITLRNGTGKMLPRFKITSQADLNYSKHF